MEISWKPGNGLPLDGVNGLVGIYLQPLAGLEQDFHCGIRSLSLGPTLRSRVEALSASSPALLRGL